MDKYTINLKQHKEKVDIQDDFKILLPSESENKIGYYNEFFQNPEWLFEKYNIVIQVGERGLGKSYSAKKLLKEVIENGDKFLYVRNLPKELKNLDKWLTNIYPKSEVNRGFPFGKAVTLKKFDNETNKHLKGEHVGYVTDLTTTIEDKGIEDDSVRLILFEEFQNSDLSLEQMQIATINFLRTCETFIRSRKAKMLLLANNSSGGSLIYGSLKGVYKVAIIKIFKKYYDGIFEGENQETINIVKGDNLRKIEIDEEALVLICKFKFHKMNVFIYKHIGDNSYHVLDKKLQVEEEFNAYGDFKLFYSPEKIKFIFHNNKISELYMEDFMGFLTKIKVFRKNVKRKAYKEIQKWSGN
jgi:hypothetical protein